MVRKLQVMREKNGSMLCHMEAPKKIQCRSDPILRLIVVAATIFGVGLRLRSIFETVEVFLFVSIKLVLKSQENLNFAPEVGWKAKKSSFFCQQKFGHLKLAHRSVFFLRLLFWCR